jgi:hypothetical protein
LNLFEFEFYSNRAAWDCSRGPPVSPRLPLFHYRSRATLTCAARERRGRAAAGHIAPPDLHASPTPRRRVVPLVTRPPLSFASLIKRIHHCCPPFSFPLSALAARAHPSHPLTPRPHPEGARAPGQPPLTGIWLESYRPCHATLSR